MWATAKTLAISCLEVKTVAEGVSPGQRLTSGFVTRLLCPQFVLVPKVMIPPQAPEHISSSCQGSGGPDRRLQHGADDLDLAEGHVSQVTSFWVSPDLELQL